jgi:pilus assembly protein CpaF
MVESLGALFSETADDGAARMFSILRDPNVSQVIANRHDRISFIDQGGVKRADGVFANAAAYINFLDTLLKYTDAGYTSVVDSNSSFIEGSFRPDLIELHGAIHIATAEVTRDEPALTVRKQPFNLVTLDDMYRQGMLNAEMRLFLETAVRGRSNIMISGGSGSGKTTLARALSYFIDPAQVVVTCEEIDELHLYDRLQNVTSLTTIRKRDDLGKVVRETTLDDLVRESLRMRADRVWVGETRGSEAYALTKACNSGHDGSVTTLHADSGKQAVRQMVTYVMESGLSETPSREQVSTAMNIVVQISRIRMDRRVITEISYLEPVLEGGNQQRLTPLWQYSRQQDGHVFKVPSMPRPLLESWERYGVNWENKPPEFSR